MKRLLWNIRLAFAIRKGTYASWSYCWLTAACYDDAYEDGLSPQDAADEEISYWKVWE